MHTQAFLRTNQRKEQGKVFPRLSFLQSAKAEARRIVNEKTEEAEELIEQIKEILKKETVDSGDIIMPMIGTIGNPYLVGEFTEFAIKNVALIKFNREQINNKYIFYFLISSQLIFLSLK